MSEHTVPTPEGVSQWVDPFLGCEMAQLPPQEGIAATWWEAKPPVGNTHPGASLPFSMVSACAYSGAYVTGYGQYGVSLDPGPPPMFLDRHEALGIAHFQQSGTGRIRMYYNYLLTTPLTGDGLEGRTEACALKEEKAVPGCYSGLFEERGVEFSLAASSRGIHHQYHFPAGKTPKVAIDVSAGGLRIEGMETRPSAAHFAAVEKGRWEGKVVMEGIPIYFVLQADTPVLRQGVWEREHPTEEEVWELQGPIRGPVPTFGLWMEGEPGEDEMAFTITFSVRGLDRARDALALSEPEVPKRALQASRAWDEHLEKIEIEGATESQREVFYSAFYHASLKPANFRDENPFTKKSGPFFFDLSTLWDLYKTQLPLIASLWPEWGASFVAFLNEVEEREGAYPISYLMDNVPERFSKQATGLCHLILADMHLRGIEADWERVLEDMWKASKHGQRFREFYDTGKVEPLSHSFDLAQAYHSMATLAKRLGNTMIYEKAAAVSGNWVHAIDEETGLLRESSTYYEGENWNYSFRLLPDMEGRIRSAGGERKYLELLDLFFGFQEPGHGQRLFRFEGLNNEPDMESPYSYAYLGRHDRLARVVRRTMRHRFGPGRGGLAGNDDSGALSSWYVWNAIGIFPVVGQPVMLIGSPLHEKAIMHLPGGDFVVEVENQGEDHVFVEEAKWQGKPLHRAWLRMDEFQGGGTLQLRMSRERTEWGHDPAPSFPLP
ncbi:MAG: glycoside hydrolase domain-containing protein [Verrucomicrobiota bacterium]